MTDKQIIIDGVDVSGCKNLMQGIVPFGCMEDRKTCSCMNNPNCLYKQLKRKEQECEELKEEVAKARIEICNQCGEKDDYNIPCKQIRDLDYGLQLEIEENDRLKQALTEIKEIVGIGLVDGLQSEEYSSYLKILQAQILQKCEVLDAD